MPDQLEVRRVTRDAATPFIIDIHYAGRMPAMSHVYGLFAGEVLEGIVAFGRPGMKTVRDGIAGPEREREVWELVRLVLRHNVREDASLLVAQGIKLLKRDLGVAGLIVLSFADPAHGHHGGVYQACSFGYYGLSAKRSHWQFVSGPNVGKHCATVVGEFRGQQNRRALLKEKYGEQVQWVQRGRKHRYIRIVGTPAYRKKALKALRYAQEPYPKPHAAGATLCRSHP